ncbi:MAG: ABC transporter substrate-binding protein [Halopenitus sp.]
MSQEGMRDRFDVNRRKLVQSLGVAGVAGLAGCAGGDSGATETATETEAQTETVTQADKQQVKMGGELIATFGADVKNYDPTKANDTTSSKAFGLVYEPLLATGFDGEPKSVLAKEVVQKDADLSWRVNLREGVKFHNGNELTAEDVKATFERYKGTPREADVYDWYDSSTVVDDYTLDFKIQEKYAPLKFALGGVPIVPKEVASGDLKLNKNPIGTGPYKFAEHDADSLFRLKRNENYWFSGSESMPEKPPIETITFRIIVEQSSQLAALKGGDVDMINNVPADSYQDLKKNEDITVTERTQGGFDLLGFPLSVKPYTNKKVRRGISRLIPRDAIVKSVYQGIGTPATSPISPLAKQFTSEEFNKKMGEQFLGYNTEKAKQLLEEGFKEAGVEKPFKTKIITNQNPQRVKWVQLIKESLNSTEFFKVEIEQFEWNTYVGKILAKDSHKQNSLIAVGWSAGWDADAYVRNLFHSKQATPACCNFGHYSNDKVDSLIEEGVQTYDLGKRKEIYQDLMKKLCEDAPATYIRFGKAMDAYRNDVVHGFNTYPIDSGEYKGVFSASTGQFTYVDK